MVFWLRLLELVFLFRVLEAGIVWRVGRLQRLRDQSSAKLLLFSWGCGRFFPKNFWNVFWVSFGFRGCVNLMCFVGPKFFERQSVVKKNEHEIMKGFVPFVIWRSFFWKQFSKIFPKQKHFQKQKHFHKNLSKKAKKIFQDCWGMVRWSLVQVLVVSSLPSSDVTDYLAWKSCRLTMYQLALKWVDDAWAVRWIHHNLGGSLWDTTRTFHSKNGWCTRTSDQTKS